MLNDQGDFYNKLYSGGSTSISNLGDIGLTDITVVPTTGSFSIGTPSGASNLNYIVSEPNETYFRAATSYGNVFNATNYERIYVTLTADSNAAFNYKSSIEV